MSGGWPPPDPNNGWYSNSNFGGGYNYGGTPEEQGEQSASRRWEAVGYGAQEGYGGWVDGEWGPEQTQQWQAQATREAQEARATEEAQLAAQRRAAQAAQAAEAERARREAEQRAFSGAIAVARSERDYAPNLNFRAPQGQTNTEMTGVSYVGPYNNYNPMDAAWQFQGGEFSGQTFGTNPLRRGPEEWFPTPGTGAKQRCDVCLQEFNNMSLLREHRRLRHGCS
jgi:hypothetical protein